MTNEETPTWIVQHPDAAQNAAAVPRLIALLVPLLVAPFALGMLLLPPSLPLAERIALLAALATCIVVFGGGMVFALLDDRRQWLQSALYTSGSAPELDSE